VRQAHRGFGVDHQDAGGDLVSGRVQQSPFTSPIADQDAGTALVEVTLTTASGPRRDGGFHDRRWRRHRCDDLTTTSGTMALAAAGDTTKTLEVDHAPAHGRHEIDALRVRRERVGEEAEPPEVARGVDAPARAAPRSPALNDPVSKATPAV